MGIHLFSHPHSLVDVTFNTPLIFTDYFYFISYTFTTLGTGNIAATPGFWQVMTTLVTLNGTLLLSMSASYILSISNAIIEMHSYAQTINAQFTTINQTGQFVTYLFTDDTLNDWISNLSTTLGSIIQKHTAYPLLQYFIPLNKQASVIPAVAQYDSLITFIDATIVQPNPIHCYGSNSVKITPTI